MASQTFKMEFELGNAAFDGRAERIAEIARLLTETAAKVQAGAEAGALFDVNGNHVGCWDFDPHEEPERKCEACGAGGQHDSECYECGATLEEAS